MNVYDLIDDIKKILPISNTNIYDDQLEILVNGAISKLETEGVLRPKNKTDSFYFDYVICVAYQVASDMDFDIDFNRLKEQYITRVNTLRSKQIAN